MPSMPFTARRPRLAPLLLALPIALAGAAPAVAFSPPARFAVTVTARATTHWHETHPWGGATCHAIGTATGSGSQNLVFRGHTHALAMDLSGGRYLLAYGRHPTVTNPSPAVEGTVKATRHGDVVEQDCSGTIHLDDPHPDCGTEKAAAELMPKIEPRHGFVIWASSSADGWDNCWFEPHYGAMDGVALPDYAEQTDAQDPDFAPARAISPRRLRHWLFSASKRRIRLAAHKTTTVNLKGGSSTTEIRWAITYRRTD